jgi:hypothetical protein
VSPPPEQQSESAPAPARAGDGAPISSQAPAGAVISGSPPSRQAQAPKAPRRAARPAVSEQSERYPSYTVPPPSTEWIPPRSPERRAAQAQVQRARASGQLVPGPCAVGVLCVGRIEAHHLDYRRPLDVTWLCQRHHIRAEQLAAEILVAALKRHYRTQIERAREGRPPDPINVPEVRAAALAELRHLAQFDSPDTHTLDGRFSARQLAQLRCYLRKARPVLAELAVEGNL